MDCHFRGSHNRDIILSHLSCCSPVSKNSRGRTPADTKKVATRRTTMVVVSTSTNTGATVRATAKAAMKVAVIPAALPAVRATPRGRRPAVTRVPSRTLNRVQRQRRVTRRRWRARSEPRILDEHQKNNGTVDANLARVGKGREAVPRHRTQVERRLHKCMSTSMSSNS